jgi:DNA-binding NarL/FixJ family response regulator
MNARVLVYSREPFLVRGLEAILRRVGGFAVLPMWGTPQALEQTAARIAPEIVLLDMDSETPLTLVNAIPRLAPCKVVLWVNAIEPELAVQAVSAGVRAILRKTLAPNVQVECLQTVATGETWFEKTFVDGFSARQHQWPLSRREGQILGLLSQGLKNKEIATHLCVSEGTVKVHMTRLFQKVGARDRFELALIGLKNIAGGLKAENDSQEPGDAPNEVYA